MTQLPNAFAWQIADKWNLDVQGNYTNSTFHRESPTMLVITPASSGVTVNYTNDGGIPGIMDTNVDLNSPASFVWNGGRVNMQDEKRETETKGARGSLLFEPRSTGLRVRALRPHCVPR